MSANLFGPSAPTVLGPTESSIQFLTVREMEQALATVSVYMHEITLQSDYVDRWCFDTARMVPTLVKYLWDETAGYDAESVNADINETGYWSVNAAWRLESEHAFATKNECIRSTFQMIVERRWIKLADILEIIAERGAK